jgi:prephenate dehydrogenase
MKDVSDFQVTIVGLGLMGGSLAGALRDHCRAVVGVARRPATVEAALARGLVDRATCDLAQGVAQADAVVLATPVRVILSLLEEIGPLLPPGCLLMDLGSTKARIVARMAALPEHVQPLGAHPMCGKETSGLAAADPALYRGATFVLSPLPRTSVDAREAARALVEAVDARPLLLEPGPHDRLVATVSHLPYLLACALVAVAEDVAAQDERVWDVAASGFRDTSRLAASDVTMMLDILLTNREAVLEALGRSQDQLERLAALIGSGEEGALRSLLEDVSARRGGLFVDPQAKEES